MHFFFGVFTHNIVGDCRRLSAPVGEMRRLSAPVGELSAPDSGRLSINCCEKGRQGPGL